MSEQKFYLNLSHMILIKILFSVHKSRFVMNSTKVQKNILHLQLKLLSGIAKLYGLLTERDSHHFLTQFWLQIQAGVVW